MLRSENRIQKRVQLLDDDEGPEYPAFLSRFAFRGKYRKFSDVEQRFQRAERAATRRTREIGYIVHSPL